MSASKKLGFWSASSLVVGNMIGSGIFMLPAGMAAFGWISLPAWVLAASGALLLAFVFKNMSAKFPEIVGGPYAYTRIVFGEFPAYMVAWGYWISIWTTNAVIAIAFVSYLAVFLPFFQQNIFYPIAAGLIVVWFLTWLNTRRIVVSGKIQLITTIIKIIPLLAIGVYGLFYMNLDNFSAVLDNSNSFFSNLTAAVTLALFAFLGLESATIPSNNIEDAKRIIPKATLFGTSLAIVIYILSSTVLMGLIHPSILEHSSSPFADGAAILWNNSARYLVAFGALVSTFGALNGWILMQGQIPMAAAEDKVFPKFFARKNRFGMPTLGLFVSTILVSAMVCLNFSKSFADTYQFILVLSVLMALLPYLFTTGAYFILLIREKSNLKRNSVQIIIAIFAFVFVIWAIVGSGYEALFWGISLLLCGIPGYFWIKRN